jgi:hypothetical protein
MDSQSLQQRVDRVARERRTDRTGQLRDGCIGDHVEAVTGTHVAEHRQNRVVGRALARQADGHDPLTGQEHTHHGELVEDLELQQRRGCREGVLAALVLEADLTVDALKQCVADRAESDRGIVDDRGEVFRDGALNERFCRRRDERCLAG